MQFQKNIHPPPWKVNENSKREGVAKVKKSMELNLKFRRGGVGVGCKTEKPSVGGIDIF